jgi:hypothetical protein
MDRKEEKTTMKRAVLYAGILALVLMVGPASAALVIDFEQGSVVGGTITYNTALTTAVGVNIPVDTLKVTNGATTTFYDLFGAGASSATDTNLNGSALVNFNTSTGAFTIVGGVCTTASSTGCPGANTLVASMTLVNGTGSSATVLAMDNAHLTLIEPDTKATLLLSALGIPIGTQWQLNTAQFNNLQATGTANVFTVGSVDIANVAVPEPASILLLGTLLVGVTQLVRRRTPRA